MDDLVDVASAGRSQLNALAHADVTARRDQLVTVSPDTKSQVELVSGARSGPGVSVRGRVQARPTFKGFSEHAGDATFGILIKDNFVVCSEKYVNKQMVRLKVAKHGC